MDEQEKEKEQLFNKAISFFNDNLYNMALYYLNPSKTIHNQDIVEEYIRKCKEHIQRTYLNTQNLIISSYFDSKIKELKSVEEIEEYRQYLFGFNSLVGKADGYSFFSDFYIQKMTALDHLYERITNDNNLVVVHTSKLQVLFKAIKNLFIKDKDVQIEEVKQ